MSDSKSKGVEIIFDVKSLQADMGDERIFGINVKPGKKGKLVGRCDKAVKDALSDAGKCD